MKLTAKDIEKGKRILEYEQLDVVDLDSVFAAGVYCILSGREFFEKQVRVYRQLKINNLLTPRAILDDTKRVRENVSQIRAPNQTFDRLVGYAYWWIHSDIPKRLVVDANNGHDKPIFFRNKLAREAPGVGLKIASLVLIKAGYENISALDIWMLRWLKGEFGFTPSGNKMSIDDSREYQKAETLLKEVADTFKVSQALLQCSIWGKSAKWNSHYQKTMEEYGRNKGEQSESEDERKFDRGANI